VRDEQVWRNVKKGWSLKRCAVDINCIVPIRTTEENINELLYIWSMQERDWNRSKFTITDKEGIPGNRASKNKDR